MLKVKWSACYKGNSNTSIIIIIRDAPDTDLLDIRLIYCKSRIRYRYLPKFKIKIIFKLVEIFKFLDPDL